MGTGKNCTEVIKLQLLTLRLRALGLSFTSLKKVIYVFTDTQSHIPKIIQGERNNKMIHPTVSLERMNSLLKGLLLSVVCRDDLE